MSEKQQRLVLSIIDFLNQSINDGTVKADDKESLEVAVQCIGEAFGVDPVNKEQVEKLSVKPTTLQSIFDVYMKTREKVGARTQAADAPASKALSADDKAKADKLKQEGNAFMSSKKYDEAIDMYNKAIALDGSNPVFYSNRAAAHSSKGDHLAAIGDANAAIKVDASFSKAYHRLGHAQYSLGDFKAAVAAFEHGLEIDPNNSGLKSGLANAKTKVSSGDDVSSIDTDSAGAGAGAGAAGGGLADMFRNLGGGGGGGGMDLASLMNNPQVMQMAQRMAAEGGLERLMQNPALAGMMNSVQSGNSFPSMQELMSNPELRDMASQIGGAFGGAGAGAGSGAGSGAGADAGSR
ncbi:hypothetical protein Agabi119p4_848 [Agaricus bisporus var. burnettii]|uniref:SGTA homodimerisation domain-containing protein n=1 Tax=Agaricus bisporus var. burnettii TaxID=192524 RepID=A0A8H7FBU8_AGABI|nr:hypothetical protein Agabi119p4_848 [Agaricus bisporus var. burnettii]